VAVHVAVLHQRRISTMGLCALALIGGLGQRLPAVGAGRNGDGTAKYSNKATKFSWGNSKNDVQGLSGDDFRAGQACR
jgi:hypothetical protein